ncbi:MAG: ECF transporter S component [Clostridiales bacterium]|nr:ECF transporter S component [Clostridiales bacterium]
MNRQININRITAGGVLIAFAIIIPQLFHLTGVPQSGQVFLPMHIPVLLSGFVLGPAFGMFVGILSPIISSAMTGMPAMERLPFMVAELVAYGVVGGLMYNTWKLKQKKLGIYLSLAVTMIAGRVVYALALVIAANLFQIKCGGPIAAVTATVTGIVGIVIQLVIIPPMIYLLEKSGYLDRYFRPCVQQ